MPPSALSLRDVTFAYATSGRPPILQNAALEVARGQITVVLGPNGSGKTTLLRLAAGLQTPQGGAITLADGTSARKASRAGRIGYIPQQLGLVRSATALDNALLGGLRAMPSLPAFLGVKTRAMKEAGFDALDAVGLIHKADVPVKQLSGGERQRVAIARTLVQGAEIVIADELIASLDVVQSHAVMELQRSLRNRGVTLLVSLHHIDVALSNADVVVFLKDGAVTAPRSPEGLTAEEARCALAT